MKQRKYMTIYNQHFYAPIFNSIFDFICKSLEKSLKLSLKSSELLAHKNDNQATRLNKNFSASFLLIYSKMFQGIIYNITFSSFLEDDITTQNQ